MEALLGIDVGTTHCKAGVFGLDGRVISLFSRPTLTRRAPSGENYYDPEELWATVAAVVAEAVAGAAGAHPLAQVAAVGVASMAETGLLVDRKSGAPHSSLLPWFDPASAPQAEFLQTQDDPQQRFSRAGIRPNHKVSLAKILWLRQSGVAIDPGLIWLSAADYIVYRLCGQFATNASLACRTYAFDLDRGDWDRDFLSDLGLPPDLFPAVLPAGAPAGRLPLPRLGLGPGTPVAVAGHDHVVAAFAARADGPGQIFDSIGTAESILGALPDRPLGGDQYRSGLAYGLHALPGRRYWMGGLSASGGSLEWLRGLLGDEPLTYEEMDALLEGVAPGPGPILYFPYLAGSQSPHSDAAVRAAFVGLNATHGKADLLKAVLEGIAYEVEFIRRTAAQANDLSVDSVVVSGGGARIPAWMQIRAEVCGCRLEATAMPETTLLGAALLAGLGAGMYASTAEMDAALQPRDRIAYWPDPQRSRAYRLAFEQGYLALQQPLRAFGRAVGQWAKAQ